jgi:hypothetical protein
MSRVGSGGTLRTKAVFPPARTTLERTVINAQMTDLGFGVRTPNVARIWDYQLGGKDSFAVDRAVGDAVDVTCRGAGAPDGRAVARESRDFLIRAVRYLAGPAGIQQFVDIGCGYPTPIPVHQVAPPDATVVYVDHDPIVLVHGRAFLDDGRHTRVVEADLRRPEELLGRLSGLVDLDRPVAVLLMAVLDLLPDSDDPVGIVGRLRNALAPGSYLALSHRTGDARPELAAAVADRYTRLAATPPVFRTRQAIARFFMGFELVEPGLVHPPQWQPLRPASVDTGTRWTYAGVARKPVS